MLKGLMWCFTLLVLQLGLLRYVDVRVAAMPRLEDPPEPAPGDAPLLGREGELDA